MTSVIENEPTKKPRISFKRLANMGYMEMAENYKEYPKKNLKFSYLAKVTKEVQDNILLSKGSALNYTSEVKKGNFLSEKEKADGWRQKFPNEFKFSKFLQTTLAYLPEHLWDKMKPFYQDHVHLGWKVNDRSIVFLVHCSEVDGDTRKLYKELNERYIDQNSIMELVFRLEEKGIESWLTIRGRNLCNMD